MSISDTQAAKKYASIATVAAAQAQAYANELETAPDYAEEAQAAAVQSQDAANSASLYSLNASSAAASSVASAAQAAEAAASAEGSVQKAIGQTVRVPDGELISALPPATDRENSFIVTDDNGDISVIGRGEVPLLDSAGKLPVSVMPSITLTEPFVVNSQDAMLALDAQPGDIAKRTDLGYSFCLAASPASVLSNWVQLTDDVLSQLGQASGASQVGATNTAGDNSTVQAELNKKPDASTLSLLSGAASIGAEALDGSASNVQDEIDKKPDSTSLAATGAGKGGNLVGFKSSLANAVDRTLQAKAQELVTVMDFGAIGNGTNDDTAAFQLAINQVNGTILSNNYRNGASSYGIPFPTTIKIGVPSGSWVISSLLDAKGKDIIWVMDPGAYVSNLNNLQGRLLRMGHHETARTYGVGDYAGSYNIQSNTTDYDANNGTIGIVDPSQLASYSSRDASALNFWCEPHYFRVTVTGCVAAATTLTLGTALTADQMKQMRAGMIIDLFIPNTYTNDSKYSGMVISWTSTVITVKGWVKIGSTTYVTPTSTYTTAIINPCTTTIGAMGYAQLNSGGVNTNWAFVAELDLVNNLSDSGLPSYNGTYTLDQVKAHGLHVNSVGSYLGTSGVNVESGFRVGYTANNVAYGFWYQGSGIPVYISNSLNIIQNQNQATGNAFKLDRYNVKFNANQGSGASQNVVISGNTTGGSEANSFLILASGGTSGTDYSALVSIYASTTVVRNLTPQAANAYTCGSSSNYWSGGYTQTAFTTVSDERDKMQPVEITEPLLDAWDSVKWVTYQYKSDVSAHGDSAITHFGAIAQRIKEVFESAGLDALKYGVVDYTEWGDEYEDGKLVKSAGNRYGLRYEQCLVVEAAYQRRRVDRLEEALMALKKS